MARHDGLTQAWAGEILKYDETPDGIMVYGTVSSPRLDLDGQIADPEWLKTALPDWMKWGNVRAMHEPIAAGVGHELTHNAGDKWGLKALVVDDDTIKKVKTSVYKGFSIGIKGAGTVPDPIAKGGRINRGKIVEVSIVDRPCNPDSGDLDLVKGDLMAEHDGELAPIAGMTLLKFETDDLADELASSDADELVPPADGISWFFGDTITPTEYRKAVALLDRIEGGTLSKAAVTDESADIAGAQAVITGIARLIVSEASELARGRQDEVWDIKTLVRAAQCMQQFLSGEQGQHGQLSPSVDNSVDGDDETTYVGLAAQPDADATKRDFSQHERDQAADSGAALPDGSFPIKSRDDVENAIHLAGHSKHPQSEVRAHIKKRAAAVGASDLIPDSWSESSKALAPDTIKAQTVSDPRIDELTTKFAGLEVENKSLRAELEKVKRTPMPGGPSIMVSAADRASSRPSVAVSPEVQKAALVRARAAKAGDASAKRALLAYADELESGETSHAA